MSYSPPDYEQIEIELWRKNALNVVSRLSDNDKNLLKKIQTYIDRFGYTKDEVREKIHSDNMFAAHFALEPRRTSFHEATAFEWLKSNLKLDVVSLPKSGKNAVYVFDRGLIMQAPDNESKPSKSLDFQWRYKEKDFYAMHKYTKESGGNQDSQYKEMIEILHNFSGATNKSNILIVIVDGPFYNHRKMQELKNYTRTKPPCSYAVHIQDVPEIMQEYEWDESSP